MTVNRIFIIRFSSFGDIVQAMGCLGPLKNKYPNAEIHWITKKEFAPLLALNPEIHTIHSYDSKGGLRGFLRFLKMLLPLKPEIIYDAHSNVRSAIAKIFFQLHLKNHFSVITRSKERIRRFLLFSLRINTFSHWPYKGILSFIRPLEIFGIQAAVPAPQRWDFTSIENKICSTFTQTTRSFVAIAPAAAWDMKRWPLEHWKTLVTNWTGHHLIILGGPTDDFCQTLERIAPERVTNLAGKLSLEESCFVISMCHGLISADTGLLHVADLLGVKALGLIGPTAFGYTTLPQVKIIETEKTLPCRPCSKDGRGQCVRDIYQECMVSISPQRVQSLASALFLQ